MPREAPSRLWYSPLLLSARVPETIDVALPCAPLTMLPNAESGTVLATVRRQLSSLSGLVIAQGRARLTIRAGDRALATVPLDERAPPVCSYALHMDDGRWSLTGGPRSMSRGGSLGFMPEVNGLFSAVDLRSQVVPRVTVTTRPHRTEATLVQTLARMVAALSAIGALLLVALESRRPRIRRTGGRRRRLVRSLRWFDALVVSTLVGWWVLAPAHWDDGWVAERQDNFNSAGGFSNYYDSFGSNLPNGYWLEWMQHWVTESSASLILLRLPALLSLTATWFATRWALSRILPDAREARVVMWALSTGFLAGALAWGMTLRPEPFTALFATVALCCAIVFLRSASVPALVVGAGIVPVAATAHHAGVLAAAPLIAVGPQLIQWVRKNPAAATAIATASFALLVLLAFVGADIAERSAEAQALRSYGVPDAWFDELRRYARLSDFHGGPPLRRASFALMILAVAAFGLRRERLTHGLRELPATALAIGFVLLIAVPSKWPWHFGALTGIAAIAIAVETDRIRGDMDRPRGWQARWLVAIAAVTVAIAWSWGPRQPWTLLDVVSINWRPDPVSLSIIAAALPVVTSIAIAVSLRRRGGFASDAPWRVAAISAPIIAVPVVIFTFGVLGTDAARAEWTVARQNLGALVGDTGCGLADQLLVLDPGSVSERPQIGGGRPSRTPSWTPPPPMAGIRRFALDASGSASTPWFAADDTGRIGVYLAGYTSPSDKLTFEWGSRDGNAVRLIEGTSWPVDPRPKEPGVSGWLFVPGDALPRRPAHADAMRVTLYGQPGSGSAMSVSAPVSYRDETLTHALREVNGSALVNPAFRTYLPCAQLPALGGGLINAPRYVVSPDGFWLPEPDLPAGYRTSPFRGISDVFDVERVSVVDSKWPMPVRVWRLDDRIPGARVLRATETQKVS